MAEPGQGEEMSKEEFDKFCKKANEGKTAEVLAAVNQDRRLTTRADGNGGTLLIWACEGGHDPLLAQGLLERGANVHARDSTGWDALMLASYYGHIAVCTVLLDRGADPDSNNKLYSALWQAASRDHLQVCLLLISRRANLMLALTCGTALAIYGNGKCNPRLTPDELEQRRAILLTAFEQGSHPDMCWTRRWPFVCVLVGCDFQPLAARKAYLLMINPPLPPDAAIPPVPIGTPELYRAYLHGCIFAHPGFWKLIAAFL